MTDWTTLTEAAVKKAARGNRIFLARSQDGTHYIGVIQYVGPRYIELVNGPHKEVLYYSQGPMKFTMLEAPKAPRFQEGQPRLGI